MITKSLKIESKIMKRKNEFKFPSMGKLDLIFTDRFKRQINLNVNKYMPQVVYLFNSMYSVAEHCQLTIKFKCDHKFSMLL